MSRSPAIHLSLPGSLRRQVTDAARASGLTVTAWIQRAIRKALEEVCPTCGRPVSEE